MNDLSTNDLSPPEKIAKFRKRGNRGKKKKKPHIGCSCQKAIDFAKAVKAAIAAPKAPTGPKAAELVKHQHTGKLTSKHSKTGRTECSQAMSDWKRGHPTPQTFTTLAKCRAIAAGYRRAQGHREAGREAMAQSLEKRYSGQHVTAKDRMARAKELRAQRSGKPTAAAGQARTERMRRWADKLGLGMSKGGKIEGMPLESLSKARNEIAKTKREARVERGAASTSSVAQQTAASPTLAKIRENRAKRKTEGVPVKEWDGSVSGHRTYAESVANAKKERDQRRASRQQGKVDLAREDRYMRLGAMSDVSQNMEGRIRLARAAELRAQRAARPTPTQSVTVEQGGTVATQAAKPTTGTRGPLPKSSKPMATPGRTDTAPRPYVKPKEKPKAVGRGTQERLDRAERIKQAKKKDVTTTARTERFQPGISGSDLKHGRTLYLSGNTFAHKDAIKQMGGRWNKDTKEWEVTPGTTMRERGTHSNLLHGMSRKGVRIEADRTVTTDTPKPRKGLRKRIDAILARVQP